MSEQVEKPAVRKKMGLGRGLDALLGEAIKEQPMAASAIGEANTSGASKAVATIAIADIKPNPAQPRRHFAEEPLAELAASIKRHGIVQPIVVRPMGDGYQIVAGERRWRAAGRAMLHEIPAIIRDFTDAQTLEVALLENIQRQDLNAMEEAEAYKKLVDEFGHSQAALAAIVEKSRSHVANMMRLLDLPVLIRELVVEGKLQMGHARALLSSEDSVPLAAVVVKQGLSVRATEDLVRRAKNASNQGQKKPKADTSPQDNADIRAVESHLADLLGLKVQITQKKGENMGSVTFEYRSLDQLDMLCQRLTGEQF